MSARIPATKTPEKKVEPVRISPPKMQTVQFNLVGTAPLMINKFSQKAQQIMKDTQEAGSTSRKSIKREAKDFEACYQGAMYVSEEGWHGIPASAFRAACISACRLVGFKMTIAKLSLFVMADGYDKESGKPLVRITQGEPEMNISEVRNATGVIDLRARPLWRRWGATLTISYDSDQFTQADLANLIMRVGFQVGLCEGRPDSKSSAGLGYGLFRIA